MVGGPEMCVLRRQGALGAATAGLQARTKPAGGSIAAVAPPLSVGGGGEGGGPGSSDLQFASLGGKGRGGEGEGCLNDSKLLGSCGFLQTP